jgi:serine/threonine protein kinase
MLSGRTQFFLGKYKLVSFLGQGGMGAVFEARHTVMDRTVAVKTMARSLLARPDAVARFHREVKAAAALNHPNIVAAFDADCVGNTHFLVMEFVEGRDLGYWLAHRRRFPAHFACECIRQVALGLQHAHEYGMVHRDIKPSNLMVAQRTHDDSPVVKILDMGLARFKSESREDGTLTSTGQIMGTPDYVAPEQAQNTKRADIRSDIFSLGCTFFHMLTGRLPYQGESVMAKLMARAAEDAPRVGSLLPEVPRELDELVARMLSRNPAGRPETPAEVAAAIAAFVQAPTAASVALSVSGAAANELDFPPGPAAQVGTDTALRDFLRHLECAPEAETVNPAPPMTIAINPAACIAIEPRRTAATQHFRRWVLAVSGIVAPLVLLTTLLLGLHPDKPQAISQRP